MGATLVQQRSTGKNLQEAYNNAVEDAIYENGNDNYNGTISTTRGVVDKTKEYLSKDMTPSQYAHWLYENDKLEKWGSAVGICISKPVENTNKIKTKVETLPQKGTRKWETVYEARLRDGQVVATSKFQTEAIKKGREYTEKTKEATYVHITKQLTSATLVSTITYKKATEERDGIYYLIGLAAE